MYIPHQVRLLGRDSSAASARAGLWPSGTRPDFGSGHLAAARQFLFRSLFTLRHAAVTGPEPTVASFAFFSTPFSYISSLEAHALRSRKRGTPEQNINITIGIIVGVLLAVFIVGVLLFCYRYDASFRLNKRRARHNRGYKSSKTSSDVGPPAEAVPAPG